MEVYVDGPALYEDPSVQGPTLAFNILREDGSYVAWTDVEKLANLSGVYIRAGGKLSYQTAIIYTFLMFIQVSVVPAAYPKPSNTKNGNGTACFPAAMRAVQTRWL